MNDNANTRRGLYPPVEPRSHGHLAVGNGHEIYWEECGNPAGKPAVFLHGGPGAGCDTRARRFFDPARYRIVLFDQRGCGRSRPHASLEHNTTWDLVADMERLREHLGIQRWQVFGGSWGSTLALAYAEAHPARVTRARAARHLPAAQERARLVLPAGRERAVSGSLGGLHRTDPRERARRPDAAFHRRLTGTDRAAAIAAARAWAVWEGSTSFLLTDDDNVRKWGEDEFALAVARIECHYFVNGGFLRSESQLLDDVEPDPPHPGGDRAGPLRRRVPDDDGLGPASRLA